MEECIYCGAVLEPLARTPAVDDDEAWAAEEEVHNEGCEWVRTRAHRREAQHGDD